MRARPSICWEPVPRIGDVGRGNAVIARTHR
jgi:hypothetical protein